MQQGCKAKNDAQVCDAAPLNLQSSKRGNAGLVRDEGARALG